MHYLKKPLNPSLYYKPMLELTRGQTVESLHHGAVAVADAHGKLIASYGDPFSVTFLRSSAKPFQILAFLRHGGQAIYHLTQREIAIMCASHSGTDAHLEVLHSIQEKANIDESELLCGVHFPMDDTTADLMRARGEKPTPNRHNCSGKHSGMLAFAKLQNEKTSFDYLDPHHPIQHEILQTVAALCQMKVEDIHLGVDGCSAPNFAMPLYHAAVGYARLSDPDEGKVAPPDLAQACKTAAAAMMAHPDMVGGPGRFDTRLMDVTGGRIVAKGGAEGYQGIGIMPGALGPHSPALGIALKIADGDLRGKARPAAAMEVLNQLGALSSEESAALAEFGPTFAIQNWRSLVVGRAEPIFKLINETERTGIQS